MLKLIFLLLPWYLDEVPCTTDYSNLCATYIDLQNAYTNKTKELDFTKQHYEALLAGKDQVIRRLLRVLIRKTFLCYKQTKKCQH